MLSASKPIIIIYYKNEVNIELYYFTLNPLLHNIVIKLFNRKGINKMGRRFCGITKEDAMRKAVAEGIANRERIQRENDIEDAKELMRYQDDLDSRNDAEPIVVFANNINTNMSVNINIDSNMTPERLQALIDVVKSNSL
jgi:hypothetical protein